FFFNDTATTEIYTLSLHDALPIWCVRRVNIPSEWCVRRGEERRGEEEREKEREREREREREPIFLQLQPPHFPLLLFHGHCPVNLGVPLDGFRPGLHKMATPPDSHALSRAFELKVATW